MLNSYVLDYLADNIWDNNFISINQNFLLLNNKLLLINNVMLFNKNKNLLDEFKQKVYLNSISSLKKY